MDIGFKPKTVFSMALMIGLLMVPRMLMYFGLQHQIILDLTSPWATFLILFILGLLFVSKWLRNYKLVIFMLLGDLVVASLLTFYWCKMSLPW